MQVKTDNTVFNVELLDNGILIHFEEFNLEDKDIAWLFQELYDEVLGNGDDYYRSPVWDILQFNHGDKVKDMDFTLSVDSGLWLNDFVSGPSYLRSVSSGIKNIPDDKENYVDILVVFPERSED